MSVTPFYRSVMLAVEERRAQLGLPMWQVDELAGTQDGYLAKAIHADAPSGRQAQWKTLQLIVDALWPEGVKITIEAAPSENIDGAPSFKHKLRHITARYNPKTRRELMSEIGKRGREIQLQFSTKAERSRIIKKGWRTRKRKARERRSVNAASLPGATL